MPGEELPVPRAHRVELMGQGEVGMAGDWFDPGDSVVIDPGGPNQEVATVTAIGSLIFATIASITFC